MMAGFSRVSVGSIHSATIGDKQTLWKQAMRSLNPQQTDLTKVQLIPKAHAAALCAPSPDDVVAAKPRMLIQTLLSEA
jgi:hypothetical protein